MEQRLLYWLYRKAGNSYTLINDKRANGLPLYGFAENDIDLSTWYYPFEKPTIKELLDFDDETINKFVYQRSIEITAKTIDGVGIKLIKALCKDLKNNAGIDIDFDKILEDARKQ